MRGRLDPTDGENRAVRAFLMQYGLAGLTVEGMKLHMQRCGFPFWPEWVPEQLSLYLTKAGAQNWLRHLFALETSDGVPEVDQCKS